LRSDDGGFQVKDPRQPLLLSVQQLVIESASQRDLRPDRVRRLAEEWDWNKAEAPTVVHYMREGERDYFHVVEGQNRVEGLKLRAPDAMVWCLAVDGVSDRERPQLAMDISGGRRVHSAYDKWLLGTNAGHPHEVAVNRVLGDLGLRLGKGTSATTIASAGVISRLAHGGRRSPEEAAWLVNQIFCALLEAYPNHEVDPHRWDSLLIGALGQVIARNPQFRFNRLVHKLAERRAEFWLREKDLGVGTAEQSVGEAIIRSYNRSSRMDQLKW
jgi:hypothetical protein